MKRYSEEGEEEVGWGLVGGKTSPGLPGGIPWHGPYYSHLGLVEQEGTFSFSPPVLRRPETQVSLGREWALNLWRCLSHSLTITCHWEGCWEHVFIKLVEGGRAGLGCSCIRNRISMHGWPSTQHNCLALNGLFQIVNFIAKIISTALCLKPIENTSFPCSISSLWS